MAMLLELSHELLHCIFVDVEPCDIAALSSTCRPFHDYIRDNRLLHRELYLRRYDEFEHDKRTNWEQQLHDRYQMERLLQTTDAATKRENLDFVATQMSKLMESAHRDFEQSKNLQMLSTAFKERQDNLNVFLCSSSLFHNKRAGDGTNHIPADNASTRQASAKLHCLYGVPIDTAPRRPIHSLMQPDLTIGPSGSTRSQVLGRQPVTHPWARSRVYDLREYTPSTLWGPFKADGSHQVDWEKVEAIMIALGHNIRRYQGREDSPVHGLWTEPFRGASPGSFHDPTPPATSPSAPTPHHEEALDAEDAEVFKIRELALKLDAMDPYGVTGTWMRVVCFLDYNDLYTYNFNVHGLPADDESRGPVSTDEAIRLIRIKLQVVRVEPPDSVLNADDEWAHDDDENPLPDWSNFKGERLPVVHFCGKSWSLHASFDPNANSRIRGTVRQTPEGEIRWTTFSIFHGEERWRSEGIQVGGIRSERGVLGNWFDKNYDIHGPAGPTAFWKESDNVRTRG